MPRRVNRTVTQTSDPVTMTLNTNEKVFQKSLKEEDDVSDYLDSALYQYAINPIDLFLLIMVCVV